MTSKDFKTIKKPSGRYINNMWLKNDGSGDDVWVKVFDNNNYYHFAIMGYNDRGKEYLKAAFSISKKNADFDEKPSMRYLLHNWSNILKYELAGLF